jgi:cobalt/nickel transport system permease protein
MLKQETYSPPSDKDAFLDRSIISLLKVISKIRTQDSREESALRMNASVKVACTLLLVVLLSLTGSFAFVLTVGVFLLAQLALLSGETIVRIMRVSLIMSLFTFIILLPSISMGNGEGAVMMTGKVFATITAVNLLSHTTRWNDITGALKTFHVPDLFILVLDITIKYIVMLGEFAVSMLYALKLRSVGRNREKYTSLSGVAGTMFIKSKEMAEDMYHAMECRGFTGAYRKETIFRVSRTDVLYILVHILILTAFLYLGRN